MANFNRARGPKAELPFVSFFKSMRMPLSGRLLSWGVAFSAVGMYLYGSGELQTQPAKKMSEIEMIDRNAAILARHPPTAKQEQEATQQRYIEAMRIKAAKKKNKPSTS